MGHLRMTKGGTEGVTRPVLGKHVSLEVMLDADLQCSGQECELDYRAATLFNTPPCLAKPPKFFSHILWPAGLSGSRPGGRRTAREEAASKWVKGDRPIHLGILNLGLVPKCI